MHLTGWGRKRDKGRVIKSTSSLLLSTGYGSANGGTARKERGEIEKIKVHGVSQIRSKKR